MLPNNFSIARMAQKVFAETLPMRFRDKDVDVHNAGDAAKCSRALTYKALKTPESNPTDILGQYRMRFGSWIEKGLIYEIFNKMGPQGLHLVSSQGDTGEHGTFYGTSWHGYRDIDMAYKLKDGKLKPFVIELKTKVGYGAVATVKKSAWSKEYLIPEPDREWGYAQQLSLYLRDAYRKTVNNPKFSEPVTDGILLQFLYGDGLVAFLEFYCTYSPETDSVHYYKVHCEELPECSSPLDITINLKDIADRWKKADEYLRAGTLAPPDYSRRYPLNDDRVQYATKTDLTKASQNKKLIGDKQCAYCAFRDTCAKDLGIELTYSPTEIKEIKNLLKSR
jgi:hypothetical protein